MEEAVIFLSTVLSVPECGSCVNKVCGLPGISSIHNVICPGLTELAVKSFDFPFHGSFWNCKYSCVFPCVSFLLI